MDIKDNANRTKAILIDCFEKSGAKFKNFYYYMVGDIIKVKVVDTSFKNNIKVEIPYIAKEFNVDDEDLISPTYSYEEDDYIYLKVVSVNPLKLSQKQAFGIPVDD